ncbi:MAG: YfiR family protein [Thermoanaerobaculaceae bacterium]|nr:YfiR family protein [Thermoanaerobaculaceae bacterium]
MRMHGATRTDQAAACGHGPALRLAVGLVLVGAAGLAATGPHPAAPEYAVKAAFVYNFAKFVEWPKRAPAALAPALRICVLGADPFGGVLDEIVAGKTIGERTMAVARVERVSETAGCAVVYVSASEGPRLRSVLAAFRGRPVLTVGDTDGFAEAGGIIGLFLEDNRVRFEINVEAADEAHLTISSRLLNLGRLVNGQGR